MANVPTCCIPAPDPYEDARKMGSRIMDSGLNSYLDYASKQQQGGIALTSLERHHLVNHVRAAAKFRDQKNGIPIVHGIMSQDDQLDYEGRAHNRTNATQWLVSTSSTVHDWNFSLRAAKDQGPESSFSRVSLVGVATASNPSEEAYLLVERKPPQKSNLISIGAWTTRGNLH